MKTLLKNAVLLDRDHENQPLDVLVEDGHIASVGENLDGGDQIVDLSGWTLLPGFIDAHVHVAMHDDHFTDETLTAWAQNGVTTVRELGMLCTKPAEEYAPWIAEMNGRPETARLIATGKYIDVAGGYGAGPDPRRCVGNIITTPKEAAAAVEAAHTLGFPGIKVGIADGMPGAPRMSDAMISAITDKAKALGMFTACHIGTSESLQTMADCGIGEAAHTPNDPMPDSLIRQMVQRHIPMVTTIGDPDKAMEPPPGMDMPGGPGGPGGMDPAEMAQQKKAQNKIMRENLKRFYDAGGTIVLGTDLMHSRNWQKDAVIPTVEMRQLVESGVPFLEAIKAGTSSAAEVVGTAMEEGTIEAGKLANLIAVRGTVDESFRALEDVPFVMHYGTIIKDQR